MRFWILLAGVMCAHTLVGQPNEEKLKFLLPNHDAIVKLQWADINSDSLLDAVAGYKVAGQFKIVVFQNGSIEPWPKHDLISTPALDAITFQIIDFDKDGKQDVIVENDQQFLAHGYRNKGNYIFQASGGWGSSEVFNRGLKYVDLDNDTNLDTVWTDGATLSVLNQRDTTFTKLESFVVFDFDNNGFRDIIFSGLNKLNKPVTICWYLGDNFRVIDRGLVTKLVGQLATGDLNHDGFFDLVVSGKDSLGTQKTEFFENSKGSFKSTSFGFTKAVEPLDSVSYCIADFDSDGLADISVFGKQLNGIYTNFIETASGIQIQLDPIIQGQDFGDFDRDGDLDWTQIKHDSLYIYENIVPVNKGPASATNAVAIPFGDYTFFYWEKPLDDHTNTNSITYDLKVFNADSILMAVDYDSAHKHRQLVSHGNVGTNNFALLHVKGSNFEIQSIDNSFFPNPKLICKGNTAVCSNVETQIIQACDNAPIVLNAPAPQALWFSLINGYLGQGDTFKPESGVSEMVFSFNPASGNACASLRAFDLRVIPGKNIDLSHLRYDCEERNITLDVTSGWGNVQWVNNINSTVVNASSIVHALKEPVVFTATAKNSYGCTLNETFDLRISKPAITLNSDHFQIIRGSSVELIAGGGSFYEWQPTESLSDSRIYNPIASPEATTEFTVTVLDSLGCSAQGKILVEVSEVAFVPTLFTPNGDNRNDHLKIYGLTQATGFQFMIYNREGAKIYETTSVTEATQSGWSGLVNGVAQPPGTYYWKVEGRAAKGDILLNGKKEGTILLVR